jgi:Kef-type K+ transport system membrane component KefB
MIVLALCLGLAYLSTLFGLAAIIGAFLAGMIASESRQQHTLEQQTVPLLALLTPFFFVVTGSKIDLRELANPDALLMLVVVTVIAIISKLVGGWLGALSLGQRSAFIIGFGMVPRGEVGVVIASLGLAAGVFRDHRGHVAAHRDGHAAGAGVVVEAPGTKRRRRPSANRFRKYPVTLGET